MSERTSSARQAVLKAWKREQQLVNEGKGTYDWTPVQQQSIHDIGIAYDEDGYAFQGHHMQSVELFPQYQSDPENIQFLSKIDHLKAHDGWYGNLTNWYYNPVTGEKVDFQDKKYIPCAIIVLNEPIFKPVNVYLDNDVSESKQSGKKAGALPEIGIKEDGIEYAERQTNPTQKQKIGENTKNNVAGNGILVKIKQDIRSFSAGIQAFWDENGDEIKYYGNKCKDFLVDHAPELLDLVLSSAHSSSGHGSEYTGGRRGESRKHSQEPQIGKNATASDATMVNTPTIPDISILDEGAGLGTPKSPHPRIGYEGLRRKRNEDGDYEWVKVPVKPTYIHPDLVDDESTDDED